MRVIKPTTVKDFATQYPDAAEAFRWLDLAERADWHSLADVRKTFAHADGVRVASGNVVTVFNVRGNQYRLIVSIKYKWGILYVLRFLTHAQYSRDTWKDPL